jgi:hypothetical protein
MFFRRDFGLISWVGDALVLHHASDNDVSIQTDKHLIWFLLCWWYMGYEGLIPMEGFAGLPSKFHIHRAHTDITWLPTAHTCFFQLLLPAYPSLEIMSSKLHTIIEGHVFEGFGFA